MRATSSYDSSQATSSQHATATGVAITSPRVKDLGRLPACDLVASLNLSKRPSLRINVASNISSLLPPMDYPRIPQKPDICQFTGETGAETGITSRVLRYAYRWFPARNLPGSAFLWRRLARSVRYLVNSGLGLLSAAMLFPGIANAQISQLDSPEDLILNSQATGIQVGSVSIYPRIAAEAVFDNNVYNREAAELDDTVFVLSPQVLISPALDRHELQIYVGNEIRRYATITEENSEQFVSRISGRLDLPNRTTVASSLTLAERIEGRGTFGDQFATDEPISYFEKGARIEMTRRGGTLGLSGTVAIVERDYDDATINGAPLDQSGRDLTQISVQLRADYALGPKIRMVAVVGGNSARYPHRPEDQRRSSGFSARLGTRFEVTDLIEVEGTVGYLKQNFDSPFAQDFSGVDFGVSGTWTPTPRILFRLEADRSIERAPFSNVAGVVQTEVRATGRYALGTRVTAETSVMVTESDFRGIERTDRRYEAEAIVRYSFPGSLSLFGGAGYRKQDSSGEFARDYDGASVRAGVSYSF